jgi:hypothetical protein
VSEFVLQKAVAAFLAPLDGGEDDSLLAASGGSHWDETGDESAPVAVSSMDAINRLRDALKASAETELSQLLAMFKRCGIRHQWYTTPDGMTSVDVSPERPPDPDTLYTEDGPLTGVSWASTTYMFGPNGELKHIDMQGD